MFDLVECFVVFLEPNLWTQHFFGLHSLASRLGYRAQAYPVPRAPTIGAQRPASIKSRQSTRYVQHTVVLKYRILLTLHFLPYFVYSRSTQTPKLLLRTTILR